MSAIQAMRAFGRARADALIASATSIRVPNSAHRVQLSGTTTVATVHSGGKDGRILRIDGSSGGSVTLTNNNDTTTPGQMDLGGSNLALGGPMDSVYLQLQSTGAWRKVDNTDL